MWHPQTAIMDRDAAEMEDVVCTLNSLRANPLKPAERVLQLQTMSGFLERAGLTVEDLDHLNIIHVTGTKGKGSTCAFTEKILRGYGFRTGFYSSPHLVQIRERIRINGKLIAKELFAKYFWQIYGRLDQTKDAHGGTMPAYFCFLTILAFHVFLQEKVDVAIVEVGIGGAYDCTNIIRKPWVCGVSCLDLDHTEILGDTIEKIAWHKGGLFKSGVPAFTVKQPEEAMAVLRDRAKEITCPLWVCPDLKDYQTDCGPLRLSLVGQHQHSNASLALQLSWTWLQRRGVPGMCCPESEPVTGPRQPSPDESFPCSDQSSRVPEAGSFQPSPVMVKGLAETEWPGRNQTLKHRAVTYFLDGAHTMRSMQACVHWFRETAAQHQRKASGSVVRVLLFNVTGERDAAAMLRLLQPGHFDFAVFCPNLSEASASCAADGRKLTQSVEDMMARCLDNERSWRLLHGHINTDTEVSTQDGPPLVPEKTAHTLVFPCILSALQWISQGKDAVLTEAAPGVFPVKPSTAARAAALRKAAQIHVLVTGSLLLVGGVLKHLDPESSK